ncbi:hypothetical protein Tsubulata_006243 [Turnera subulata]|uniref:Cation/H+ exchanger domain-containing protein n=1 Tax=Turnera subulata TaxID=218843 RepID=A0A9Q0FM56_9ROSI|nr:hypothetical protein Tsubulata_006243 [Turnera subulata]
MDNHIIHQHVNVSGGPLIIKQCFDLPPLIHSEGFANYKDVNPLEATLPRLELFMFAAFIVSYAFHSLLKRVGATPLVSHILTGLFLGLSGLGRQEDYRKLVLSYEGEEVVEVISAFGFLLFIFQVGAKMDATMMTKTGRKSFYTAFFTTLVPILIGFVNIVAMKTQYNLDDRDVPKLFTGLSVHTMSPFPVVWQLVSDLKLLNTELGRVGLAAGLITDSMSLVLLQCGFFTTNAYDKGLAAAFMYLFAAIGCVLYILFIVRPAMVWVIEQTPEGWPVKGSYMEVIIIGTLSFALTFNSIGLNMFVAALGFGLSIPPGPPLASGLVEKLDSLTTGVFTPLFVAICVARADMSLINFNNNLHFSHAIIVTVCMFVKFFSCLLTSLYHEMSKRDAIAHSLIMSSEGTIDIAVFTFLTEKEEMTEEMFAFSVLIVLLSTATSSILVSQLYDPSTKYAGYQKRNMENVKELRILACIYRPDNITSAISFLEVACTSSETPATVDVLHLIKLIGRATPLFISHSMQKKTVSQRSYSENVITAFNHFHRQTMGIGSMDIYTTVSQPMFMYEDICRLALDSLASFILLPFHRRWQVNGTIESEDTTLRNLNITVLERAPCSVGILIDRGNQPLSVSRVTEVTSFHVAMIFLGGSDDREALVLAERMALHQRVTVVHFRVTGETEAMDWEKMLDSEAIKPIKYNSGRDGHLKYEVQWVADGLDTLQKIQALVKTYDFFIVGRRKDVAAAETIGLEDLDDYPELGCIGSLLASMDVYERYMTLVVQQQKTHQQD